jgi:FMN-dependent NADH-azoreductase
VNGKCLLSISVSDDYLTTNERASVLAIPFGGLANTPEQHAAWGAVEALATEFKSANKILISVPMWNFGVPYVLKHYIDVITQPGLTFSFNPATGFAGLVTGRPATVIQSSSGTYLPGSGAEGYDFLTGYLKTWLGSSASLIYSISGHCTYR